MTQKRIEAEIVAADPDSFAGVRDNVFKELSLLVGEGLLAEAHAMVPIVETYLHLLAIRRIAVLTADVSIEKIQKIVNAVGRIPGLEITGADYIDNSKWMLQE